MEGTNLNKIDYLLLSSYHYPRFLKHRRDFLNVLKQDNIHMGSGDIDNDRIFVLRINIRRMCAGHYQDTYNAYYVSFIRNHIYILLKICV
jgi:hypothetical protein